MIQKIQLKCIYKYTYIIYINRRCASALKVSVNEHQSITAFRVNDEKGTTLLNEITEEEKEEIVYYIFNNKNRMV